MAQDPLTKSKVGRQGRDIFVLSLFIKVLLFPAYRSTDFEVHRNWLAITKSLPLRQWYYDTTSEWTLDYPPFFAYFEKALSTVAYLVDPTITKISAQPIATWPVVAFQRSSVILSELLLGCTLYKYIRPSESSTKVIAASLFLHPGLIFIDSIHFQYNGMLLGLLVLSLTFARDGNLNACAATFAVLLNFKHIFAYLAPPYLVYLFRAHCFDSQGHFQAHRLVQLGVVVLGICSISFGPFLLNGGLDQIKQILSRLFPFQRGLNHAYWAGNVWALYSAVDRILVKYLQYRQLPVSEAAIQSMSRGLVGDITFGVLPEVKAVHCFGITIALNAVYLHSLWLRPTFGRFIRAVTLSAYTSFLFGFHVHEKAILLVLFPMSLIAADDYAHYRTFVLASVSGIFALFPLLIEATETPIKLIYACLWFTVVFPLLSRDVHRPTPTTLSILVLYGEALYLAAFPLLQVFVSVIHPWYFNPSPTRTARAVMDGQDVASMGDSRPVMEFLPLMLTSVYCAIGIVWSWLRLSYLYMKDQP